MLQQTITLVVIRNPFTLEREIMKVPYLTIQTAVGYTKHLGFEDELVYSVNGKLLEKPEESYLQPDDYLVVCPVVGKGGDSKNPLQVIAGIALSVVTMGVGGLASGAGWGAAMTSWTAWGYLAAAATMYIGGQLLSSAFGWDMPDMSFTDSSSSTTYSWNDPTINTKQGGAVPLTYGTVKVTNPTILSQHITTDGTNQYYNLLLCGGEGPIDSISDIRINDNPITNFQNVVVETRLGTNDQTCMTNFADTFSDQNVDYELDESYWSTLLLDGNNGQAIEVTLDAKGGLYTLDNNGGYTTATVTVNIQYRKYGATDWLAYGTYTLSGATISSVRGVYRLDGLQPAQYEVRMQVTSRSAAKTATRSMVRVWWSMASLIVYDDFTRPGKVLVGIKALATSQLSGSLSSVTWLQTRNTVNVWNPNTAQYEQKPATNPAWACYDMIHLCKYLKDVNTGVYGYYSYGADKELFMWQRFKDWADYCDTYKLTVNILISDLKKLFAALEPIEACGRGKVLMQGTKFSCVCDAPATPVQMFGMGNIYMDSFQEDFLSLDNRANSVEVTYNNKDKNYQRDSFIAYADDYDTSDAVDNPTQITLNGKTSYEEAYREAKYKLRCNQYLIRTCSFDVDVDAIACQLGDVILVGHDVPSWGVSGRIVKATASTLTLPSAVAMEAGKSYGVYVRLNDDTLVYKAVAGVPTDTTTNVISVTTPFNVIPEADNVFMFGVMGKEAKPFRVASITRSSELKRRISCLEYVEAVYKEEENIPVINYSAFETKQLTLDANEIFPRPTNGSNIQLSWSVVRSAKVYKYNVYAGRTEKSLSLVSQSSVNSGSYLATVESSGTWFFKFTATDIIGRTLAVGSTAYTIGTEYLRDPGDITSYYENNKIVLAIEPVPDYRSILYEWRKGATWSKSVICGKTTQPSYIPTGDGHYWVSPTYNGVYAENPTDIIVVGTTLASNVLAVIDEKATGWQGSHTDTIGVVGDTVQLIGAAYIDSIADFDAIESLEYAGGVASYGVYNIATDNVIDIGTASRCNVDVTYALEGMAIISDIDSIADFDSVLNWDGAYASNIGGVVQINVGDNDGVYSGWQNFYHGNYFGRYYDFRIVLTSSDDSITAVLKDLKISVDAPDIIDTGVNILIPADGATITYNKVFHSIPGPQITILDAQENDIVYLPVLQQSKTGFFIQVKNRSSGVARHINWLAQKY